MRVLFTTIGSPSHGRAQLPLARALAAAGHEVRAATTPHVASVFERDDVQVTECMPDLMPGYHALPELTALAARTDLDEEERGRLTMSLMARELSGSMARDLLGPLLPLAREYRPDLILRDGMDMGSVLTAELLGIPQLPTPSGSTNSFDPAELLPGLNSLREKHGLPLQEDPLSIVPRGRVDYVPPAYSFARHLPISLSYRQTVGVDRHAVLPQWITELPTDRPLVFAALGTALPMLQQRGDGAEDSFKDVFPVAEPTETLRTIIEALTLLEECTVILSTSGLPVDIEEVPSHIHVTEYLPQPLLLESVDLFLTHGGFNSVRESLRTATPMAVLPQFGDQHGNAQRVEELGLGRGITDRTPEGIAAVCRAVLADSSIGAEARRARLAMLALPEIETAVADLENLVG
ncbi:DUF1205 domain-containing protein [Streptomyces amakusaensis]|uniref:Glycosyltransferase n=1 Tax=Streptomyces amakusaensis TaxID=67271 RepID=A0ABW0AKQ5_9ACTN